MWSSPFFDYAELRHYSSMRFSDEGVLGTPSTSNTPETDIGNEPHHGFAPGGGATIIDRLDHNVGTCLANPAQATRCDFR